MSIHLRREDGAILQTPNGRWCFYLELAHFHFGWNPEGTKEPKGLGFFRSWKGRFEDGGYASSDGQLVTASDARALAAALERALADDSVNDKGRLVADAMNDDVRAEFGGVIPPEIQPMLIPGEVDPAVVNELVDFCRSGAFRIE